MIDFTLSLIKLIRIKHWLKNGLIFAAMLFAFRLSLHDFLICLQVFLGFSFFASSIYIINDIFDIKRDRLHPKKKFRPLAAGKIKIWQAFIFFCLLLAIAVYLTSTISMMVFWFSVGYFVINIFYSFGLKHLPIVDVMILSIGFVIRVIIGAYAIGVSASRWILLCTFFISLFLSFGKRKNEMEVLSAEHKNSHRKSISEYTDGFIDQMLGLTAGVSVIFYALYTIDPNTVLRFQTDKLIYTTPLVVFGIFRYFHLLYNKNDGGDPVVIFSNDWPLIIDFLLWIAFVVVVYLIYAK